ncbi:MAG TPA: ATP synthase F1 subunit delta [Leeuwenhoekiella sp.]|nr:ATP synthase F1 subunit delta [Leeuwenhoekiella sp.]
MSIRAASRYAKAVYAGAKESKTEKPVYDNMKDIEKTLSESKELRNVLESPQIKSEDKRASLHAIFNNVSEITTSLLDILIDNGRAGLLEKTAQSYIQLYNEEHNIVTANVTTAVDLDDDLEQKILAKVKQITGSEQVIIKHEIDQEILGGFILRVGDMQYDASVSNQLERVHKEFSKRL